MHNDPPSDTGVDERERLQLVEELQLAKRSSIQSVRHVVAAPIAIEIWPADSMHRECAVASGKTREIKSQSVSTELARPVAIGAFYQVRFDASDLDLDVAFVRCQQITMLGEDRFEARFQFLTPIVIPGKGPANDADPRGRAD